MKRLKALGFGLLALSLFVGCSTTNKNISHQTALFWHESIYKNIKNLDLDSADDRFTSLEIEHPLSPFIPIDLLNLAQAHLKNKEYQLAEYYINEYEKRYADNSEIMWCEYKKGKIKFKSINNAFTNQKKIDDTISFFKSIINRYPNSIYNYELNTMKEKLIDTKIIFNNQISSLYNKLNKPKAAKLYETNTTKKIIPPHIPWYKKIFYW